MSQDTSVTHSPSSAQNERLSVLVEEMGETLANIGKAGRHGLNSRNPLHSHSLTNKELITQEIADVMVAIDMLVVCGDIDKDALMICYRNKLGKIVNWLHHEENINAIKAIEKKT